MKYLWLERRFSHSFPRCHLLYVVSSARHPEAKSLLSVAKRRGIPIVWNQNGAYFPHAYGPERARAGNLQQKNLIALADYVLYQSAFARESSEYFLGKVGVPGEILYNAVDTEMYRPLPELRRAGLVLLTAGSHDQPYRLRVAIETFMAAKKSLPDLKLLIVGRISEKLRGELKSKIGQERLDQDVTIEGPYSPQDISRVFNRAHILLHPTYADVCPSVVLEAMACGLPVVYSATGGTPELVGDAGVGVPGELNWTNPRWPSPTALADAVIRVAGALPEYSRRARARVVEKFDLKPWLDRHEAVFRSLLRF